MSYPVSYRRVERLTDRGLPVDHNIVEQDHRFIKRLVKLEMGFGAFNSARQTIRGYEVMHMLKQRQVQGVVKGAVEQRANFIAKFLEWLLELIPFQGVSISSTTFCNTTTNTVPTLSCAVQTLKETLGSMELQGVLLYWSNQVLEYLNLKRLSVGLNDEEQRLLSGLQGAVLQELEQ